MTRADHRTFTTLVVVLAAFAGLCAAAAAWRDELGATGVVAAVVAGLAAAAAASAVALTAWARADRAAEQTRRAAAPQRRTVAFPNPADEEQAPEAPPMRAGHGGRIWATEQREPIGARR